MEFAVIKLSYATSLAVYGTPNRAKPVSARVIEHQVSDLVDFYIYETLCPEHAIILEYGSTQRLCNSVNAARRIIESELSYGLPF